MTKATPRAGPGKGPFDARPSTRLIALRVLAPERDFRLLARVLRCGLGSRRSIMPRSTHSGPAEHPSPDLRSSLPLGGLREAEVDTRSLALRHGLDEVDLDVVAIG